MNKIRRTICILFIFLSTNFAFSITNDFYVKYQDYIVFDKALSTNTDYEFVVLYSANLQKAKILCIDTKNQNNEILLLETQYPISWFSGAITYSKASDTVYFFLNAPENKNGIYEYQGLYSCKKQNNTYSAQNIKHYFVPSEWMFENAIFNFINKNHNDYEGLLNYIYSLSDSGEKTFCVKDKNGQLLTETSALRYCKENNLIYNGVFKFLNTHIMRIENNEITDQSAFTLNGNPQLADTILKETMHDTYFLQNSEGIWVLNATHKEIKTSDSAGNISSTWIPAYFSIFLLEDKNGNIASSTPGCLNNIKISPDEELLKKNGFVSNDYLILKDKNGQFCYAYKNNQIVSFNSYEEAVKYSFSNEEIEVSVADEMSTATSTNNKLIIYIISAILALLAIAELIYIIYIKSKKYKTHLNKKDKKLIFKIQDEERSKVSKDIHDSVVQNIRAIRLEAEMLEVTENSNQRKEKIVEEMTNVISLLRNICYNLSPAELSLAENMDNSNVELLSVIDTLSKQFTAKTKIPCAINLEKDIVLPELDVEVSRNVVRVVQECFNNIEKHSFATRVQILVKNEVKNNSRNLIIFIIDDGIGCEVKNLTNKKTHFGIRNMIERMNMVGGSIEFFSEPNEGLNIQLQIPYGE